MPIVDTQLQIDPLPDGRKYVVVRYYDQDATEYMETFFCPDGFDISAKVNGRKVELDAQLAEQEFEAIIGGV